MRKKSDLSAIGVTLNAAFHKMDIESRMKHYRIHKVWQKAVGARIAEQTRPVRVRNDVLFVEVSSSVWVQELHFLRDKILEKINKQLSPDRLKEIRFKIGHLPRSADKPSTAPRPALTSEETAVIEKEASPINDPDIRRSFQAAMAAHFTNKKKNDVL